MFYCFALKFNITSEIAKNPGKRAERPRPDRNGDCLSAKIRPKGSGVIWTWTLFSNTVLPAKVNPVLIAEKEVHTEGTNSDTTNISIDLCKSGKG